MEIKNKSIRALLDTGADHSVVSLKAAKDWGCTISVSQVPKLVAASEEPLSVRETTWVSFRFGGGVWKQRCLVCEKLAFPLILGIDFLTRERAVINCAQGVVTLKERYAGIIRSKEQIPSVPVLTTNAREIPPYTSVYQKVRIDADQEIEGVGVISVPDWGQIWTAIMVCFGRRSDAHLERHHRIL